MHILLPLLGVLGAFGYWYFALKNAGKAAGEIADVAGRARGAYKRNQFRKKADASVLGIDKPEEELTFAKWAADHVVDPNNVSLRFSRLWTGKLAMSERRDLVDLVHSVAAADGAPSALQGEAIQRLKTRLAITA